MKLYKSGRHSIRFVLGWLVIGGLFLSQSAFGYIYRWDTGAIIADANAGPGVNWSGWNLAYARLDSANLSGANLSGTNLSNSCLACYSSPANLANADLSFANFSDAGNDL